MALDTGRAACLQPAHRANGHWSLGSDASRNSVRGCSGVHVHPPGSTAAIGKPRGESCPARAADELPTLSNQRSRGGFRNYPKTASDWATYL